jgi:hypothetical protein
MVGKLMEIPVLFFGKFLCGTRPIAAQHVPVLFWVREQNMNLSRPTRPYRGPLDSNSGLGRDSRAAMTSLDSQFLKSEKETARSVGVENSRNWFAFFCLGREQKVNGPGLGQAWATVFRKGFSLKINGFCSLGRDGPRSLFKKYIYIYNIYKGDSPYLYIEKNRSFRELSEPGPDAAIAAHSGFAVATPRAPSLPRKSMRSSGEIKIRSSDLDSQRVDGKKYNLCDLW